MFKSSHSAILVLIGVAVLATPAMAGMPAVLPSELPTRLRLQDSAVDRLTAISFFLGGILVSALVVQLLWNYLQRDFTWLPKLSVTKSFALVLLWGLLFVIVLTMISGARELMTPGAWRKQGFTYKLAPSEPEASAPGAAAQFTPGANAAGSRGGNANVAGSQHDLAERRRRLAKLRSTLWLWAGAHDNQFPSSLDEVGLTASDLTYFPGRQLTGLTEVLVCEPEASKPRRLVLRTDGEIGELTTAEAIIVRLEQP